MVRRFKFLLTKKKKKVEVQEALLPLNRRGGLLP